MLRACLLLGLLVGLGGCVQRVNISYVQVERAVRRTRWPVDAA
jgi:hypothetical protein